jgi:hypothetical protein
VLWLWRGRRIATGFVIRDGEPDPPRRALLGVRACELHALAVQDQVFLHRDGLFTDPYYAKARERLFLVAVECEHPGGTCFCASMGTGPEVRPERVPLAASRNEGGAGQVAGPARVPLPLVPPPGPSGASERPACDLVLTELDDAFVARAASPAGQGVLGKIGLVAASAGQVEEARRPGGRRGRPWPAPRPGPRARRQPPAGPGRRTTSSETSAARRTPPMAGPHAVLSTTTMARRSLCGS